MGMQPNEWRAECAADYMGIWLHEPQTLARLARAVVSGRVRTVQGIDIDVEDDERARPVFEVTPDHIAIIALHGTLMKPQPKMGGTSTVQARRAIRAAAAADNVHGIMLHIDSPGGTAAGTADLADDVLAASQVKPTAAFGEDMVASAAYWIASQTERVSITRMTQAGSIGSVAVVDDTSGEFEAAGIKVHVVASDENKGAFIDGAPIAPEHLEQLRELVMQQTEHFFDGVMEGRGMTRDEVAAIGGRVLLGEAAVRAGLADAVESFDEAMAELRGRTAAISNRRQQTQQNRNRLRLAR